MDDKIRFIGLAYDDDRDESTAADQQRLADVLAAQGFSTAPADVGPSLEVWLPDPSQFLASVRVGDTWMLQVAIDEGRVDEDLAENAGNIDALARLIGVTTEFAGSYLGFVTVDDEDDLSFMEEDAPVQLEQPLAAVYLGRRYLADWPDEPDWAASPKARWELPDGVLLVPAVSPLEVTRP